EGRPEADDRVARGNAFLAASGLRYAHTLHNLGYGGPLGPQSAALAGFRRGLRISCLFTEEPTRASAADRGGNLVLRANADAAAEALPKGVRPTRTCPVH